MEFFIDKIVKNKYFVQFRAMSKNYLKTNILFSTFVVTSLINSTLVRILSVKNYFDINPIIADLAIILIVGSFGYYIKPKHQFKYFFTWSVVFTAICLINSMYYNNYLSFASFSLLATSMQIVDVGDAVVENVMELKDFSYLWQIAAMLYVNYVLKSKKYYERTARVEVGKVRAVTTLTAGLILIGLFISTLNSVDMGRLNKQWNREFLVLRFGVYTYQVNDLVNSLRPQISPMFGYDSKAKLFREYYEKKALETKKDNKYTDIFKGKNVIAIHAESIQQYVLDTSFNGLPVAPNLKKMAKEGLYFSNFYSQESVGTSSDTEFTLATSLMPTSSGTVFINYFDREYVTLQKEFKNLGYYTFSMHGNNGTFWNRNVVHKELGYDRFYSYPNDYELDETIGLGLSDASFFRQSVPKIKEINDANANFFGTMIMLTNHTPFSDITRISDYAVDYKYDKMNEETGKVEEVSAPYMEGTKLGNYFKSVNYADEQIGNFLDSLDEAGVLDNTVVVIYGDHDAKLKRSEFERFYNYDYLTNELLDKKDPNYKEVDYYQYELNRKVPLIIWTKNKQYRKEITKVMGMYDIQPTLGNMFGFENKYALGNDIFSVDENVVIFPDGNWLTNKMYYNSQKQEGIILNPGEVLSADYIDKYNLKSEEIMSVSDAIIVYDLIKKSNETQKMIEEYGD